MKYSHLIFDLDGTLVDSAPEIHEAAAAVCQNNGLTLPSLDYIHSRTGSPPNLFFLDHGCNPEDVDQLVADFRAYLTSNAGNPACVSLGAAQLLEFSTYHSIRVSLATTKPTGLARILLKRYGLADYFNHIQGTDFPLQHKPKPDILNACITRSSAAPVAMVGDTLFDVEAANNAGIDSIAVASGSHGTSRLEGANPTYLVSSLYDIIGILAQET